MSEGGGSRGLRSSSSSSSSSSSKMAFSGRWIGEKLHGRGVRQRAPDARASSIVFKMDRRGLGRLSADGDGGLRARAGRLPL